MVFFQCIICNHGTSKVLQKVFKVGRGIGSVGCHGYMKETQWLMQELEVGNALGEEYWPAAYEGEKRRKNRMRHSVRGLACAKEGR